MRRRDGYPPGVPCWVDTAQPDPDAAVAFYGGLFGWGFHDLMPSGSTGKYLVARLDGRDVAAIGWSADQPARSPAWSTHVAVENSDGAAAAVVEAGGRLLAGPVDVLDAGRMTVCADPAGAVFCTWEAGTHRGAQAVNEPGSWNWSDLVTRDPAGAAAFYGAVFGWVASPVDLGGVVATMWQRPGYGDFLAETVDPGIRERHAQDFVPEGFSDAVGWLEPLDAGADPAVPSYWRVTFAVVDADASAVRAESLGGTVVVAPYAAGPTRVAVLADPQGATFTISAFSP